MKPTLLFDAKYCVLVDPHVLQRHPRNATISLKQHDPAMFAQLKKSLLAGWKESIKVQAGTNIVIGGHQRLEAALEIGFDVVPALYENVDDAGALKMLIQDNARFGHQDSLPLLTEAIIDLDTGAFELEELGLDMSFIEHLAGFAPSKVAEEAASDEGPAEKCVCPTCKASHARSRA